MKIKVECFKTLKDFQNNAMYRKGNGKPGVYLWGFSLEPNDFTIPSSAAKFFPYYVGKHHKDMYSRTHEHITTLAGGNFSVFDVVQCHANGTKIGVVQKKYQDDSRKAKPTGGTILPDSKFPNLLYFPEGVHKQYAFFFDKVASNQIDLMLRHICIMYFEIDKEVFDSENDALDIKNDKLNIDILEKKIGQLVGYDELITKPYNEDLSSFEIEIEGKIIKERNDLFISCLKKSNAKVVEDIP